MKTQMILITTIFTLTATIGMAQFYSIYTPDERNIFQVGIKVGFNNSNLYDTKGQDFVANPIFGPVFGGFLSIPLSKFFGIQPEVLYSAKGYAGSGSMSESQTSGTTITNTSVKGNSTTMVAGAGSGDPQNYSFVDRMNFIDVPLMLQLKPFRNFYLLGGPEYSYLLSRSYTFTHGVTSETTQQEFQNDNIRHNILGFISGADLNFNQLTFAGRIAWDLQDNNGNGTSTLPRYRNFWGQFALGFRF
jgi:hypothetical protein